MKRCLATLPDPETCRQMLESADKLQSEIAEMKKAGSTEHRKMAIMETKVEVDRALATGGALPWPICCADKVDIFGKIFDVVWKFEIKDFFPNKADHARPS